jgi:hypothetical protein
MCGLFLALSGSELVVRMKGRSEWCEALGSQRQVTSQVYQRAVGWRGRQDNESAG